MAVPDVAAIRDAPGRSRTPRDVFAFFGLTLLLTTPFWVIGALSGIHLLPGLPVAALAVICPAAAALFLSWRFGGMPAAWMLLTRTLDFGQMRLRAWWLPILLISPAVSAASFFILRYSGSGVPDPNIDVLVAAVLFTVLLISAMSEELGWSGFALDPLQARLGVLPAALLIGAVWSVWHYPALLQAHRSASWIGWWTLGTVSMRMLMVWLYNRTDGSVFGVATLHAVSNLCWQLFPFHGSWFDPRVNGAVLGSVALAVALISIHQSSSDKARALARIR